MTDSDTSVADAALIGVDWGSSRLRASAVSFDGDIIDTVASDAGVFVAGSASELEASLRTLLHGWADRWPAVPIYASGMVGSRTGLKEVPYVSTPAGVAELSRGLQSVRLGSSGSQLDVTIIPGLVHHGEHGVDVMRGEETALLGWALTNDPAEQYTVLMPGTHSKWVNSVGRRVLAFCTFPTGELFSTLLHSASLKSLLRPQADEPDSLDDFDDGLAVGLRAEGILHDYFSIRAQAVSGDGKQRNVRQFLSGLLIGYEIAEARDRGFAVPGTSLVIIGGDQLSRRYEHALRAAGLASTIAGGECVAKGWLALAHATSGHSVPQRRSA